jgi:hypothetical protein
MAPSSSSAIYKPGILAGYSAALGGGCSGSGGGNRATRAAVIDYGNDEQMNTKTPPSCRPLSTFGTSQVSAKRNGRLTSLEKHFGELTMKKVSKQANGRVVREKECVKSKYGFEKYNAH